MKKLILFSLTLLITSALFSQDILNRCPYKGPQIPSTNFTSEVGNFLITDTDGNEYELYEVLDSGYTVFIDLFFTTCTFCQEYADVIEAVYQNTGAGEGDILFWGITKNAEDNNATIDAYKAEWGITNPCAGIQGNGVAAHNTIVAGQNFFGWPTCAVICPDRSMYFDVGNPPTEHAFDPYFADCALTDIYEPIIHHEKTSITNIYPNPTTSLSVMEINLDKSSLVKVEVFNLIGLKVFEKEMQPEQGLQSINIELSGVAEGKYFVRLMQDNQFRDVSKIMVIR